jgi:murein DD-endopeptidase MepM/ murein hydrolase activator NlpD
MDSYVYNLPFAAGSKFRVLQGYGGLFSHAHTAALDFGMPVGTPVHAARDGVVYAYKENSNEGGASSSFKNKANYIIIRHEDGSYACYWHLKENGVVVKHGPIGKGALIGYSGATGMVLRPHLHFSVKRILSYDKDSYLRTKFRTTDGIQLLSNGSTYERPLD